MAIVESKVIEWFVKMAQNHPHSKHLTPPQKLVRDGYIKILLEAKHKLKRIEEFGGAEHLISQAIKTSEKQDLFADPTADLKTI